MRLAEPFTFFADRSLGGAFVAAASPTRRRRELPVACAADKPTWQELLLRLTGIDVRRFPACHAFAVVRRPLCVASPVTPIPRDTS